MSETPVQNQNPAPESEHAWVHEVMGAYLAGGLDAAERGRFDGHVNGCPECFDAFTEARDADRGVQRVMAGLMPGEKMEEEMVVRVRERITPRWVHPMVKRAGYGVAAAVALAATGVFANYAMRMDGMFNNPLSQVLVAESDAAAPELAVGGGAHGYAVSDLIPFGLRHEAAAANVAATWPVMSQLALASNLSDGDGTVKYQRDSEKLGREVALPEARLAYSLSRDKSIDGVVQKGTENARDAVQDARRLYDGGKLQEAKDLLGKAAAMDPSNTEARYLSQLVEDRLALNGPKTFKQQLDSTEMLKPQPNSLLSLDSVPLTSAQPADMPDSSKALGVGGRGVTGAERMAKNEVAAQAAPQQTGVPGSIASREESERYVNSFKSADAGDVSGSLNALFGRGDVLADSLSKVDRDGKLKGGETQIAAGYAKVPALSGSEGLTKVGGGTLALSDGANRYTGMTTIAGGGILELNGGNLKVNGTLVQPGSGPQGAGGQGQGQQGQQAGQPGYFSLGAGLSTNSGVTGQFASGAPAAAPTGGGGSGTNGSLPGVTVASGAGAVSISGVDGRVNGVQVPAMDLAAISAGKTETIGGGGGGFGDAHWEFSRAPGAASGTDLGVKDVKEMEKEKGALGWGMGNMGQVNSAKQAEPLMYSDDASWKLDAKVYAGPTTQLATGGPGATMTMASATQPMTFDGVTQFGRMEPPAGSSMVAVATPAQPQAPGAAGTRPSGVGTAAQDVVVRKIIRNGDVAFEVRSFEDTYVTVSTVVGEEGGFVSSTSSEKLANGKVRGSIVVRVPPERLDRFLMKLRALGDLKGMQIGASDVTKQYTDLDSEVRALRAMQTRLEDLIKNGKGEVKDLVEAEKQLGEYRVRIEKIMGEMRYYDNLVGMATITITAYEKDIQKPTSASEQENVSMNVETEDVETKYTDARKIIEDAKGRIVESELKKYDADQFAARIVADVSPEKADFVAAQLKQLGKISGFNRDRKQTATGGVGAPGVTVEQKETRITMALYNLANIAPRETAVLTVAVPNVEAAYKNVIGLVRKPAAAPAGQAAVAATTGVDGNAGASTPPPKATGRVVSSNLTGQQPEQMTADIRADMRAEDADAVLAAIKDSGEVLTSTMTENPDTANVTAAKRGIQLKLVNMASVSPKEATALTIAVPDVEAAYNKIRDQLRPAGAGGAPPTSGAQTRIVSSSLTGQQPEQKAAEIRADLRADQAETLLSSIRGSGEVMASAILTAPEGTNATWAKRGLQLRLVNVAAVPPRETQQVRAVAMDVSDSFRKLTGTNGSLTKLAGGVGGLRVLSSQLNQSDPSTVTATLALEVPRKDLPAVESAIGEAGIEFLSRNVVRSTDTVNTLDSKVRIQVDSISSAESVPPKRTTVIGREVATVATALEEMRPAGGGANGGVKEVEYTLNKEANGRVIGHIVLDVPTADVMKVLAKVQGLGGTEKVNQVTKNAQVPETRFAKERIDLTLTSVEGIVESGKGVGSSVRAALSTAAGALIYSLYLVLTGVLFLGPWVLIGWLVWKVMKRKKAAAV